MWFFSRLCESKIRLDGKTAVLTGGNCGIGQATAKDFYKRGANVIILCRNEKQSLAAVKEIEEECKGQPDLGTLRYKYIDLGNLATVRRCAEEILKEVKEIHLLVNNAGIMCAPGRYTVDGFEIHFGVNHLGHFLLTLLLLPTIIQSAPARIVNVSSVAGNLPLIGGRIYFDDLKFEKQRYSLLRAYGQSKLANMVFTKELSRRLKEVGIDNVTTYSLHPGIIATNLGRSFDSLMLGFSWLWKQLSPYIFKSVEMGAQTTIYCAVDEKLADQSGLYYSNCSEARPASAAYDPEVGRKLWDVSIELTELENYDPFRIS